MASMAPQIKEEVVLGEANILQLFPTKEKHLSEKVVIAGCRVESGSVKMGEQFRVVRGDEVVWTGTCRSMKRLKLEVRQVGKVMPKTFLLESFRTYADGQGYNRYFQLPCKATYQTEQCYGYNAF